MDRTPVHFQEQKGTTSPTPSTVTPKIPRFRVSRGLCIRSVEKHIQTSGPPLVYRENTGPIVSTSYLSHLGSLREWISGKETRFLEGYQDVVKTRPLTDRNDKRQEVPRVTKEVLRTVIEYPLTELLDHKWVEKQRRGTLTECVRRRLVDETWSWELY